MDIFEKFSHIWNLWGPIHLSINVWSWSGKNSVSWYSLMCMLLLCRHLNSIFKHKHPFRLLLLFFLIKTIANYIFLILRSPFDLHSRYYIITTITIMWLNNKCVAMCPIIFLTVGEPFQMRSVQWLIHSFIKKTKR